VGPSIGLPEFQPYPIDYFDMLLAKFETQSTTSRPHHLTSMALINIQQEKGESLRLFMERLEKVALN